MRITRTYLQLEDVIKRWKAMCDTIVVYEHDEDANRVHCHLYLGGVNVSTKRLKQISGLPNLGNTLWSWKTATEDIGVYITYMSKGKMDPCYLHNFEFKDCEALRLMWVTPPPKVSNALAQYRAFVIWLEIRPVEMRLYREDIELLCRRYMIERDQMFNMVNQNHVRNYTATYCFVKRINSRPQV